jgi:hypothetical protein
MRVSFVLQRFFYDIAKNMKRDKRMIIYKKFITLRDVVEFQNIFVHEFTCRYAVWEVKEGRLVHHRECRCMDER